MGSGGSRRFSLVADIDGKRAYRETRDSYALGRRRAHGNSHPGLQEISGYPPCGRTGIEPPCAGHVSGVTPEYWPGDLIDGLG